MCSGVRRGKVNHAVRLVLANELIGGADMVISGTQESYAKALSKADRVKPKIDARVSDKWYVEGADFDYIVVWQGGQLVCNCYSGALGKPCYHAAAVALREGKDYGVDIVE